MLSTLSSTSYLLFAHLKSLSKLGKYSDLKRPHVENKYEETSCGLLVSTDGGEVGKAPVNKCCRVEHQQRGPFLLLNPKQVCEAKETIQWLRALATLAGT